MNFRFARHTTNLDQIKHFYVELLGLEVLGSFENHDNYDGVFIGKKEENWQLEFTVSDQLPNHTSDEDDLLVFYLDSQEELYNRRSILKENGVESIKAKNPYWNINGVTYQDPDGFRLVLTVKK